jgi:hypothetical protein
LPGSRGRVAPAQHPEKNEDHDQQKISEPAGGRAVLRHSMEKYAEAVPLYGTTDENLQTIAQHLELVCDNLGGFMCRPSSRNSSPGIKRQGRRTERIMNGF